MENTIRDILRRGARLQGQKVAVRFENESAVTYGELDRITNRLAAGLARLGIKKGSKVAFFLPNSLQLVFAWLATAKLGGIEVPINLANKGDFLSYIINNSESTILFVADELIERVKFVEKDLRSLKHVVVCSKSGTSALPDLGFATHHYDELFSEGNDLPDVEVKKSDPFSMIYTSGTTGPSKGVLVPTGEAVMAATEYLHAMQCTREDVFFTCLPLFHANAQLLCVLPALISGNEAVIYERFSAGKFWRQIRDARATVFNSLGAMSTFIFNQPVCEEEKDNPVRAVMAAPMPASIFDEFAERFELKIIEGYGLTETGMITYNPWEAPVMGSCGKPTPNYEVKIFDEADNELPPNSLGEIVVRAKAPYTMCLGYYGMPEKTVDAFRNFFFHTGDAGIIDENGYLYFKDRMKDYIRRRGENISSFEVEQVVVNHPRVAECAAVGVTSEHGEDEVLVAVVPRDDEAIDTEELMEWCIPRMPYFAVPRYVRFLDQLPKTPNEKIRKNILRETGVTRDTWDREAAGYSIRR